MHDTTEIPKIRHHRRVKKKRDRRRVEQIEISEPRDPVERYLFQTDPFQPLVPSSAFFFDLH
jgi:hypothetical protein